MLCILWMKHNESSPIILRLKLYRALFQDMFIVGWIRFLLVCSLSNEWQISKKGGNLCCIAKLCPILTGNIPMQGLASRRWQGGESQEPCWEAAKIMGMTAGEGQGRFSPTPTTSILHNEHWRGSVAINGAGCTRSGRGCLPIVWHVWSGDNSMMAMKRSVLASSLQNLSCFGTTSSGEEDLKLIMMNRGIKERRG